MKKSGLLLLTLFTTSQLFAAQPTRFERFKKNVIQTIKNSKETIEPILLGGGLAILGIGICFLIKNRINNRAHPTAPQQNPVLNNIDRAAEPQARVDLDLEFGLGIPQQNDEAELVSWIRNIRIEEDIRLPGVDEEIED